MHYQPKQIANFFIRKGVEENNHLNPMQVIKMTYIAHGWYLAFTDKPLINELVEAWKFGPVIYSLYHKLKHYYNNPITEEIKVDVLAQKAFEQDTEIQRFLGSIWDKYKKYTGYQLSILTHAQNTPWAETIKPFKQTGYLPSNLIIDDELIKRHYKDKLKAVSQK
jgi:uncharacterized phage-associated protein